MFLSVFLICWVSEFSDITPTHTHCVTIHLSSPWCPHWSTQHIHMFSTLYFILCRNLRKPRHSRKTEKRLLKALTFSEEANKHISYCHLLNKYSYNSRVTALSPPRGFRVRDVHFRVWDLGFRVWDLGFRVWDLGFRVLTYILLSLRVQDLVLLPLEVVVAFVHVCKIKVVNYFGLFLDHEILISSFIL